MINGENFIYKKLKNMQIYKRYLQAGDDERSQT